MQKVNKLYEGIDQKFARLKMYARHEFPPQNSEKSPALLAEADGVIRAIRSGVDQFKSLFRKALKEPDKTREYLQDREHFSTEVGFLRGRNIQTHKPEERMEACDLLAIEQFPLERILAATSKEDSLQLHEEATYLRNIYHSQIVTLEIEDRKGFEDLRGLPRIEFIRFLTEKVCLAYDQDIEINKENYEAYLLDDNELRLERIKRDIRHLLKEASMIKDDAPKAFAHFQSAVAALATEAIEPEISTLTEAPEIYGKRKKRDISGEFRKETPEEFTRRVYEKWLGKGLLRPDLRDLDKGLYEALYKHGIPRDFETLLPTAQGRRKDIPKRTDSERLEARLDSQRRSNKKRANQKVI